MQSIMLHRQYFMLIITSIIFHAIGHEQTVPFRLNTILSIRHARCSKPTSNRHECCTGTVLTPSFVLTSADCVANIPLDTLTSDRMTVVYHRYQNTQTDPIIIEVNRVSLNSRFALLNLSIPLDFSAEKSLRQTKLSPEMILPERTTENSDHYGRTVMVSDFHLTHHASSYPYWGISLVLLGKNDTRCHIWNIDDNSGCYKMMNGNGSDICQYIYNKPIFQWLDNRWKQIGISSNQTNEADDGCIGIYHRLATVVSSLEILLSPSKEMKSLRVIPTNNRITYACKTYEKPCGCSFGEVTFDSDNDIPEEAVPYSWGMLVSIRFGDDNNQHRCIGTILTLFYILTSASCIADQDIETMAVVAGIHNWVEDFSFPRYVREIFIHPAWNSSDPYSTDDIAILNLFIPVSISTNGIITQTCIPYTISNQTNESSQNSSRLAVPGWRNSVAGETNISDVMQQGTVYELDNSDPICQESLIDPEKQLCVRKRTNDECFGDSGSPILRWTGQYWEQIGIIGRTENCQSNRSAASYTRLLYYFDWIESVLGMSLTTTTSTKPPRSPPYQCNRSSTCGCGRNPVSLTYSRIVGGEDAIESSWPMAVHLLLNNLQVICGGTILSESFVLTAAHCLRDVYSICPWNLSIVAGVTNRSDTNAIVRKVDELHIHPDYVFFAPDRRHDIALLHLETPLIFDEDRQISRTCIRQQFSTSLTEYPPEGTRLAIVGWGTRSSFQTILPTILQQAEVFAIDNNDDSCLESIRDPMSQLCAGLPQGGKDACQGDSGGGLFRWTNEYWEQVGIVSFGTGCGFSGYPGIYTRLLTYYKWIEGVLKHYGEQIEPGVVDNSTEVPVNLSVISLKDCEKITTTELFTISSTSTRKPTTESTANSISTTSNHLTSTFNMSTAHSYHKQSRIRWFTCCLFILLHRTY